MLSGADGEQRFARGQGLRAGLPRAVFASILGRPETRLKSGFGGKAEGEGFEPSSGRDL